MDNKFREFSHNACPVLEKQELCIGVPISIRGFAEVGEVKTICGEHEVICGTNDFQGHHDAVDEFVVKQKITVEIPLTFGAKTQIGESIVLFDCEKKGNCEDEDKDNENDNDQGADEDKDDENDNDQGEDEDNNNQGEDDENDNVQGEDNNQQDNSNVSAAMEFDNEEELEEEENTPFFRTYR